MENENTVNNTPENKPNSNTEEKKFTQDEVNRIVQERLARAKNVTHEANEKESALNARETDLYIREQIFNNKLPKEVYEDVKDLDKDTFDKVLKIITPYAALTNEPILNTVGPTQGRGGKNTDDDIRKAMGLR